MSQAGCVTSQFDIIATRSLLGKCLFLTVTHSLKYFYTASSGIENPSYVSVGLVDDVQISYCDSRTKENIPKQDWMNKVNSEHPNYWKEETETCLAKQQTFKISLEIAKQRFNQTGGVHVFQQMYGCEWDDETGEVKGYDQFGSDGEDLIMLDPQTHQWISPKPQAVITANRFNNNRIIKELENIYLTQTCLQIRTTPVGRNGLLDRSCSSFIAVGLKLVIHGGVSNPVLLVVLGAAIIGAAIPRTEANRVPQACNVCKANGLFY
uniref:MHC class I-like antigen recognition-like domain-containing protein n=1 Tax=Xiphophorus couchianus TaxID=32473 RepID=A0A3B5LIU1_9TELE